MRIRKRQLIIICSRCDCLHGEGKIYPQIISIEGNKIKCRGDWKQGQYAKIIGVYQTNQI